MHEKPRPTPTLFTKGISNKDRKKLRHEARLALVAALADALDSDPKFARQMRLNSLKAQECELDAIRLLDMFNKMENLGQMDDYLVKHPPSAGAILILIDLLQDRRVSEKQREAALAKAAYYEPAKKLVLDAWHRDKGGCKNKADFSRLFSRRVKNELGIDVIPGTIAREWLRGQ